MYLVNILDEPFAIINLNNNKVHTLHLNKIISELTEMIIIFKNMNDDELYDFKGNKHELTFRFF